MSPSMVSGWLLNHLNLPVTDLTFSLDFYVCKLPFRYVRHLHARKVILRAASFDFFLEEHPRNVSHPNFHFGIQTSLRGVYEWQALLQRLEIPQVVGPQPTGRAEIYVTPDGLRHVLYFADPDGHIIEIYSHIGNDVGYVDEHWAGRAGAL
jgi:catechol 2,3-dioxygenase-like lactoylglutathione lyase family enzyme